MALEKVVYEDNVTVIDAAQLNAIQDEIIRVSADKSMGLSGLAADDQIMVSAVDADGKPTGWRKKYRDMLNVRDFGAKGDGSTDDTAAIQAAIDMAASTLAMAVYVPAGTYIITAPLVIQTYSDAVTTIDGVKWWEGRSPSLIGENPSTAIIKKTGNAAGAIITKNQEITYKQVWVGTPMQFGDEVKQNMANVFVQAPNGTLYTIAVDNSGNLSAKAFTQ